MISNYLPDTGCFLIGSQKSVRIYKPAGTWSLFFNFSSTTFCFSAALIFFASPYSETDLNCSGAVPQLMKSLKRGIFHVESFNLPSSCLSKKLLQPHSSEYTSNQKWLVPYFIQVGLLLASRVFLKHSTGYSTQQWTTYRAATRFSKTTNRKCRHQDALRLTIQY